MFFHTALILSQIRAFKCHFEKRESEKQNRRFSEKKNIFFSGSKNARRKRAGLNCLLIKLSCHFFYIEPTLAKSRGGKYKSLLNSVLRAALLGESSFEDLEFRIRRLEKKVGVGKG